MKQRIRLGLVFTLLFSVTLSLVAIASTLGPMWIFFPFVLTLALSIGLVTGLLVAPLAIWAAKTGKKNMYKYGPVFWLLLAGLIAISFKMSYSFYWTLVASVTGLLVLGVIPNRD